MFIITAEAIVKKKFNRAPGTVAGNRTNTYSQKSSAESLPSLGSAVGQLFETFTDGVASQAKPTLEMETKAHKFCIDTSGRHISWVDAQAHM